MIKDRIATLIKIFTYSYELEIHGPDFFLICNQKYTTEKFRNFSLNLKAAIRLKLDILIHLFLCSNYFKYQTLIL